ncbi:26S proteasome non-ATPase regulatory subunit 12-like [Oppia nitens]|uniref:26S proteasome non-ATPase regulatory subunit 12-like n=1 Tax=Oppia nitens TaxID=1686743 RepID=UPI0023DC42D7|nr:26S proteasome non-ATPase regulatory subunit 12-like [Oppia nitens]
MSSDITYDGSRLLKMEVDYSNTVDEKIPVCERLAKEGKLSEALDILLSLEKQTRTGSDTHSTSRVLVAIVKLCFEAKNFKALNENIVLLTKRRSQIKQSITKMIEESCSYVDLIDDKAVQLEFIDTLRTVTAGKIYVEVERARLTLKLALMKEKEEKIEEAADILQELQVETFGSMDKKEKVELILEQMRFCLAKKDFVRTQIISKKIQTKYFEDPEVQDLKFKYYNLMIQLDQSEGSYLAICKHYLALFNSPSVQSDVNKRTNILKNCVIYIILAPFDNQQSDLINRVKGEKALQDITRYNELIKMFTNWELINWRSIEVSLQQLLRVGGPDLELQPTGAFDASESGNKRWNDLKNRVVEYNIRVMAKYYSRLRLQRMSELLGLNLKETEEALSVLVVNKTIWAKVDRSSAVVNFSQQKDPNQVLNDWSKDINSLMQLVCKTNHLINKEEMIHQNYSPSQVEANN